MRLFNVVQSLLNRDVPSNRILLYFTFVIVFLSTGWYIPHSHSGLLAQTTDNNEYVRARFQSSVNPVMASYVDRVITQAETQNTKALILQLDTPGGLMNSMKKITDRVLNADVPVVVWVGPGGARATSAGVFITYSAHVAAMARGTNIGAAHPVKAQGSEQMDDAMQEKVVNDAIAQLTGLARKRNRNEEIVSKFIKESISINAREAVEQNVVNFRADSMDELISKLSGKEVTLENGTTVVFPSSDSVSVRDVPMSWKEDFLNTIVNPNLVYILLMLGIYGLIYEFSNPGVGLGLAVGGICLLLGMFGMSMLPISYTGLGLIVLGIALMILDIFVPSFGVLTMGGLLSFVLGSVMLFESEVFTVSYGLIGGFAFATLLFILVVGFLVLSSFNEPVAIGDDSLVGRKGTVKETLDPDGMVYVWGEYWKARSEDGETIEGGKQIEVVKKNESRSLIVKPAG